MFDPNQLEGTIQGLRTDARSLRDVAANLGAELAAVGWAGGRADRFRHGFEDHRRDLLSRAEELDHIAEQVVALQRDVKAELSFLFDVEKAAQKFFNGVQQAAQAAAQAAQRAATDAVMGTINAGTGLLTGDMANASQGAHQIGHIATDVGSLFGHWPWNPGNLPPHGDPRWRDVHQLVQGKAGSGEAHGVCYATPRAPSSGGGGW